MRWSLQDAFCWGYIYFCRDPGTGTAATDWFVAEPRTQRQSIPGKQDGGGNVSSANLELWEASLGHGTTLHKSWDQNIPFLP